MIRTRERANLANLEVRVIDTRRIRIKLTSLVIRIGLIDLLVDLVEAEDLIRSGPATIKGIIPVQMLIHLRIVLSPTTLDSVEARDSVLEGEAIAEDERLMIATRVKHPTVQTRINSMKNATIVVSMATWEEIAQMETL